MKLPAQVQFGVLVLVWSSSCALIVILYSSSHSIDSLIQQELASTSFQCNFCPKYIPMVVQSCTLILKVSHPAEGWVAAKQNCKNSAERALWYCNSVIFWPACHRHLINISGNFVNLCKNGIICISSSAFPCASILIRVFQQAAGLFILYLKISQNLSAVRINMLKIKLISLEYYPHRTTAALCVCMISREAGCVAWDVAVVLTSCVWWGFNEAQPVRSADAWTHLTAHSHPDITQLCLCCWCCGYTLALHTYFNYAH